ncbi:MAG: SdrD B-like domain-containing protein, partial [Chitinophagaceae bacterium]
CSPVTICTGVDATSMVTAAVSPAGGTITWNTGNATTATSYTYTVTNSCGTSSCNNTITRTIARVGNYVWSDLNNNGLQDEAASAGINGVTVELWDLANGNVLAASTTTSNDGSGNPGYYQFSVCTASTYYIKFPLSYNGYPLTTTNVSDGVDGNNDASGVNGLSIPFILDPNGTSIQQNNQTIDAGYVSCVKPSAGLDATVCAGVCTNLTGTSPSTGTWAAMGTNPLGATLGTTTAGIAQVCFATTASGNYNFIYTVAGGCSDTVRLTVNPKPSAGVDQSICAGNCMNITGTGSTGTWTAIGTNPVGATLGATTAGVAQVCFATSASGTYSYIYTLPSGCSDTMVVTVNAKPSAGTDQTLCLQSTSSSVTLNATVAGGTWSAMAGNPATSTIVTPNAQSTVVNNYTVSGTYNYIYTTASGCRDTVMVTVNTAGTVGNYVWNDLNGNGLQDEAATSGINGVTVQLLRETAPGSGVYSVVATTTTANNTNGDPGYYQFDICQSANYRVQFPTTNGSATLTTQNSAASTDGNSDPSPSTGLSQPFAINVLGSGTSKNNPTIDAGYYCAPPATPTCNVVAVCAGANATAAVT